MLDSDPLSVERMPRVRDIAGREHIRRRCLKLLVHDDPVVDLQAGVARPARTRGATPMPTTAKSHSSIRPLVVRTSLTAPSPSNASTPSPSSNSIPCSRVHVAVEGADLCAEDALVGQRERIDDRDIEAALARGGRELAADPAGADDHHPATSPQALAQRIAVLQRAQVMDADELGARDRDSAGLGARRQQQPVVVRARDRRRASRASQRSRSWSPLCRSRARSDGLRRSPCSWT